MLVLAFPDAEPAATALAAALGCERQTLSWHRFPDGESLLTLPPDLPAEVLLFCCLHHPDERLVPLMIAARQARLLGAKRLTLITPYLCYMRQDKAFAPGQAVSQTIIGGWLADLFDAVLTVDPHLHRIERLQQAIPLPGALALSAAPLIGAYLRERLPSDALLLGPDAESRQWVAAVAEVSGHRFAVAGKDRRGDREVRIELPVENYRDRTVALIDDVISSGHTIAAAARLALAASAHEVVAACTHALLAAGAEELLREAGVSRLYSTTSIPHASNVIDLTPLLTGGCQELMTMK